MWQALEAAGQIVIPLQRHRATPVTHPAPRTPSPLPAASWDVASGRMDLAAAGQLDAVIHLAGETIAQRWTKRAKRRILESRVQGTRLLSDTLAALPKPPATLAVASAIGIYGDGGAAWLDEASPPGRGFLADVTRQWEEAAAPAGARGIRVVHLRLGIVLASQGGALGKMLTPFRCGLGGTLGGGRQYWSWISIMDAVRGFQWVLETEGCRGSINLVAPNPVTNAEFTKVLGGVLRRPTLLRMPAWVVEWLFGQMGREAMLSSARVKPSRLVEAGFVFRQAELEPALREVLAGGGKE